MLRGSRCSSIVLLTLGLAMASWWKLLPVGMLFLTTEDVTPSEKAPLEELRHVEVLGAKVSFIRARPAAHRGVHRPPVLFLHGAAFSKLDWQRIGTMAFLGQQNIDAVAVDLPSYGESPANDLLATSENKVKWLNTLVRALFDAPPVLISPSVSGQYSIPAVAQGVPALAGFVALAPVGCNKYNLGNATPPTLILYGSEDRIGKNCASALRKIRNSTEYIKMEGTHSWYIDAPEEFHRVLSIFLDALRYKGSAM